ncbi:MAG: chemotaxis protein CheW [Coriobacteriia bacterium]|nr:chemotaxis protein CheW [Coriobacteriia bacterium]
MTSAPDIIDEATQIDTDDAGACAMVERVLAFFLGTQRYALPIERVREIQQIVAFSEVPSMGSGVVGMVNLRGSVVPAVDMRRLVGLEPLECTLETPMIIADVHGETLALLVDEVQDVFELPPGCLQESPALHALSASLIGVARVGDGLVYVLDLDRLVDSSLFGGPR